MTGNKNLWDISNRPSTKTKLEILGKVFNVWLTIWNKRDWVSNEWYVIDLFAGRGKYIDEENEVYGSPLIFLDKISQRIRNLRQELNTYEIGDTIEVGDLVIKVNSTRTAEKDEWDMLEEGYIYLLVDISIENTGNQEAYLDTYYNFRLVDKNGRNYEFVWAEKAKGRIEGNLGAGRKIAGELSYGIPNDIKEFELEISDPNPGMLGTEMVIINILLEE